MTVALSLPRRCIMSDDDKTDLDDWCIPRVRLNPDTGLTEPVEPPTEQT